MKTLIDLLNEFCREKRGDYVVTKYREKEHSFDTFVEGKVDYMTDLYVVSKRCGFIKWLVENDKIDIYPCHEEFRLQIKLENGNYGNLGGEDRIIMMLSISDTPIELLISLIK